MTLTRDHALAAAWGGAEATFFFLVPDIWLSRLAATGQSRRAYAACLSALGGALLGGTLTHRWARTTDPDLSRHLLTRLPAINDALVTSCEQDIARHGERALLTGPLRGVPYKLYARAAGAQHRPLPKLLAWSIPGRLPRFLAVTTLGVAGRAGLERWLGAPRAHRATLWVHALAWTGFYGCYFRTVGRD